MTIRLGDEAPESTAETTEGTIDFHRWKDGKWAVLFSRSVRVVLLFPVPAPLPQPGRYGDAPARRPGEAAHR
jgi:hypothetical protein